MIHRPSILQVLATSVTVGASLLAGVFVSDLVGGWPNGLVGSQPTFAAQSIDGGDVTITLADAQFSSTRSTLTLDLTSKKSAPHHGGAPVILRASAVLVSGLESIRPVTVRHATPPTTDASRYVIETGPPTLGEPYVVTIEGVLLRSAEGTETLDGPWSFTVPIDQLPVDPVSETIALGSDIESNGISLTTTEVRLSSDETLVSYSVFTEAELSDVLGAPVIMLLPDGERIRGSSVGGAEDLIGEHLISFPPLPEGVTDFDLKFGPYLAPVSGADIDIVLPGASAISTPGKYRISGSSSDALTLVAEELTIKSDGFRIDLGPDPESASPVVGLAGADVTIEDDKGNTYALHSREVGFGQLEDGTVVFREDVFNSAEPLDPSATQLVIRISEFAILESGPWDFHVDATTP